MIVNLFPVIKQRNSFIYKQLLLLLCVWFTLLGSNQLAFALLPQFQDQLVQSELDFPTSVAYLPDSRILVTQNNSAGPIAAAGTTTIPVLDNDNDSGGTIDTNSVTIVSAPNNGSATVLATGEISHTHNGSTTTSDQLTYTVDDNDGAVSSQATISITVRTSNSNLPPIAQSDLAVPVSTARTITIPVLDNDSDSDGTLVTDSVSIVTAPFHGTVAVDITTGAISYTYFGNGFSSDNFDYTVKDNDGTVSNIATVFIRSGECRLDIDGNGNVDALSDGLLFIRHLFGSRGDGLIDGAVAEGCTRCSAVEIEGYMELCGFLGISDIDGNGVTDALTDGLLNIRYLFGIRGAALIDNAVGDGCNRCSAVEIEGNLQVVIP
jgi:hypothetical protein